MHIEIITLDDLQDFKSQLLEEMKKILSPQNTTQKTYLKTVDVRKMLAISSGTLCQLRRSGQLPFTKVGRIIFYNIDDVHHLLNNKGLSVEPYSKIYR